MLPRCNPAIGMKRTANERRRTIRRDVRARVRLYTDKTGEYENAHLTNINQSGMYVMTRRKLAVGEKIQVAVPSETDDDPLTIKAEVIRKGIHRSWGLFSYACRIID